MPSLRFGLSIRVIARWAALHWRRLGAPGVVWCALAVASTARAQAPDQLAGVVIRYKVQAIGVSVLADNVVVLDVDGTFGELYFKTSISLTLQSPRQGAYAYARTTADTGTLTLTPTTGSPYTFTLTFDTATSGSLAGGPGAGTFNITPIPLPGPLVNTSQRGFVSDTQAGIIGFVVPTGQTTLVLVRAIGPGLAAFAVDTRAVDPRLAVFREQTLVAENDDWDDEPAMKATITMTGSFTGAFPLSDGAKDAAIVLLLGAGNYTVQVRSAPGETLAEVLGEVYAVP